jgi:hypothetical protein
MQQLTCLIQLTQFNESIAPRQWKPSRHPLDRGNDAIEERSTSNDFCDVGNSDVA